MATNIVEVIPSRFAGPIMAIMEPARVHPHFLLCNANIPPIIVNTALIIDNTIRTISIVPIRRAINGASAGGRKLIILMLPIAIVAIVIPTADNALSAQVTMFRIPAVVGIQVFLVLVSILAP